MIKELTEKINELLETKEILSKAKKEKMESLKDSAMDILYQQYIKRVPSGTKETIQKETEEKTKEYIEDMTKPLDIDPRFICDAIRVLKAHLKTLKESESESEAAPKTNSSKKKITKKQMRRNAEKAFESFLEGNDQEVENLSEEEMEYFEDFRKKHEKEERKNNILRKSTLSEEEKENVKKYGIPSDNNIIIECQFISHALGLSPNSKEIYEEFIQSRSKNDTPDSAMTDLPEEAPIKGKTVFPKAKFRKDDNGFYHRVDKITFFSPDDEDDDNNLDMDGKEMPYIMNHQFKGFLKEAFRNIQQAKKVESGTPYNVIKGPDKIVDTQVFVRGAEIALDLPKKFFDSWKNEILPTYDENGELQTCQRTIRVTNAKGSMTSLACSEIVPAGSKFRVHISYTIPKLREFILMALERARYHGWSQWRNAGWGKFRFRIIDNHGNAITDWNISDQELEEYI